MTGTRGDVTELLARFTSGDREVASELMSLVYGELRRLAGGYLRGERPGHTLQPTALVHEVYLRLVNQDRADWKNRAQFFGVAAQLMRRILVDYARARRAGRRGGERRRVNIDAIELAGVEQHIEKVLAVDEALARMEEFAPEESRVVELRYFGGLTIEETAEVMQSSPRTVKRRWATARAWLKAQLAGNDEDDRGAVGAD